MPDKEQQEKTLSERLVKEAVGKGMDSPMREQILEAVEESEGSEPEQKPTLPLVGALVGLGAALGYLAGRQQGELEETPLGEVDEPEIIEDITETGPDSDAEDATEEEAESDSGGGRKLSRILLALGTLAGVVLLRRKLKSEEDEWEPIEEFEPAVDADEEDEADEEEADADEEEESEADESDEGDEDEE